MKELFGGDIKIPSYLESFGIVPHELYSRKFRCGIVRFLVYSGSSQKARVAEAGGQPVGDSAESSTPLIMTR